MNNVAFDIGIFVGVCGTLFIEAVVVGLIRVLYAIFGKDYEDAEK